MTHLAQTFPVAAFTDLNEALTEEALELKEINKDQTTHNPSAISPGEPIILSVSGMTDNRNIPQVFHTKEQLVMGFFLISDDVVVFI